MKFTAYLSIRIVTAWLAIGFASVLHAATLTVSNTAGDDTDDSLRDAIANAMPGDTIVFDIGLDGETIILNGMQLAIDKSLVIDASALPSGITISGDRTGDGESPDDSRVFRITGSIDVTMRSLTIFGGRAPDGSIEGGGGILNEDATLTLEECILSGNRAGNVVGSGEDSFGGLGGGISNIDGTVTLEKCTISYNRAGDGSTDGMSADFSGFGGLGGGISNNAGTATLRRCTIAYNRAGEGDGAVGGLGGGISNAQGTLILEQCTVVHNRAGDGIGDGVASIGGSGGGITSVEGILTLEQCTIAHNQAGDGIDDGSGGLGGFGGGIVSADGTLTLEQCTIVHNSAGVGFGASSNGVGGSGGGIHTSGSAVAVSIADSIVAGNSTGSGTTFGATGPDWKRNDSTVNALGINLVGDNSEVTSEFPAGPFAGTAADPLDASLGDLADNGGPTETFLPLPGSPALNPSGGAATSVFPTDQRGFERIVAGILDIGAVEAPDYAGIDAAAAAARAAAVALAARKVGLSKKIGKLKKKAKNAKRKGQVAKSKKFKKKIKKLTKQLRAL